MNTAASTSRWSAMLPILIVVAVVAPGCTTSVLLHGTFEMDAVGGLPDPALDPRIADEYVYESAPATPAPRVRRTTDFSGPPPSRESNWVELSNLPGANQTMVFTSRPRRTADDTDIWGSWTGAVLEGDPLATVTGTFANRDGERFCRVVFAPSRDILFGNATVSRIGSYALGEVHTVAFRLDFADPGANTCHVSVIVGNETVTGSTSFTTNNNNRKQLRIDYQDSGAAGSYGLAAHRHHAPRARDALIPEGSRCLARRAVPYLAGGSVRRPGRGKSRAEWPWPRSEQTSG